MNYWSSWFLRGWAILIGALIGWELWGYLRRLQGDKRYPPLSNIVALVPWWIRDPAIFFLGIILIWHFHIVEREQLMREMGYS